MALGITDLTRSSLYYQVLSWQPSSDDNEQVVFPRDCSLVLNLYERSILVEGTQMGDRSIGFVAITPAYNCASRDGVDRLFPAVTVADGQMAKMPQEAFQGGYSEYVADPDRYLWEIAYSPFWPFDEQGSLVLS